MPMPHLPSVAVDRCAGLPFLQRSVASLQAILRAQQRRQAAILPCASPRLSNNFKLKLPRRPV
eukprot:CAMPEP_0195635994 /NCGR_PEP_ID=MMETSP0815-20121206/23606_1 /TAXON_ID=97485 /ORGANISM="Prymnesium parvum, Strain Texoma1" /LENGTH=62 /DNA_ID=CAMNT_0040778021 /DNA_START=242 /DNA_END=427 /DNA_ORIENTATION=+